MSCHIPPLDNPSVRRAISLVLNKQAIADAASDIKSIRRPINNYIPSRVPGFIIPNEKISRNPEEAVALLAEAGFSEENSFPSLNLFIDEPKTDSKYEIFKEISEQLSHFGIRVRLRYYSALNEVKTQSSPYLILMGHLLSMPDPEDMIRPLFYSESIFNVFGYTNPQLDKFLTLADTERSRTKRTELFHLIEEILYWDVPAIPLYSYQNRIAMQPYVRGVEVPPMGLYYLDASKIWLDK
jgi:ABC-type transport system substrate-binding protein